RPDRAAARRSANEQHPGPRHLDRRQGRARRDAVGGRRRLPRPAGARARPAPDAGPHVRPPRGGVGKAPLLVVGDTPPETGIVRSTLEEAGYQVHTANTLGELEGSDPMSFDLILMDVHMPELFGDDVASILRHVRGARARIVLFSNLERSELEQRTSEAELDG